MTCSACKGEIQIPTLPPEPVTEAPAPVPPPADRQEALPADPPSRRSRRYADAEEDYEDERRRFRRSGTTARRGIPGVVWTLGIPAFLTFICCGGLLIVGIAGMREQDQAIDRANALWAEGKQEEAVTIYKRYPSYLLDRSGNGTDALRRVVEFEVAKGHTAEARRWIDDALQKNLQLSFDSAGARQLLQTAQQEQAERLAQKARQEAAERQRTRTLGRGEFRSLVMWKTEDQVLDAVGKPDTTQELGNMEFWYYRFRTIDPVTNRTDFQAQIVFENGVVTSVNY